MNSFINSVISIAAISITTIIMTSISVTSTHADECFNINGETIEINSNTRAFVCFQHDTHNEKAGIENCDRCHHLYDEQGTLLEGESSEDQSCSNCHASSSDKKDSKKLDITLTARYHKLCRDCHLAEKKGPVVCGECHIK